MLLCRILSNSKKEFETNFRQFWYTKFRQNGRRSEWVPFILEHPIIFHPFSVTIPSDEHPRKYIHATCNKHEHPPWNKNENSNKFHNVDVGKLLMNESRKLVMETCKLSEKHLFNEFIHPSELFNYIHIFWSLTDHE